MEKEEAKNLILEKIKNSKRERRRKANIVNYIKIIIIFCILSICFFIGAFYNYKKEDVNYNEKSDIDYSINLKENRFFKDSALPKNNRYVVSLIDNVKSKFKYELDLGGNVNTTYSYKIIEQMQIKKENTEEVIYAEEKELISQKDIPLNNTNSLSINDEVVVDYDKYNSLANEFVKEYGLSRYENKLNVYMYITINDIERKDKFENRKVASLSIPLSENTATVEINYDILNNPNITKSTSEGINNKMLIWAFVCLAVSLYFVVVLVRYITHTTNALNTYKTELKKIVNDYRQYIQVINNEFNMEGYQKLELNSFIDLLEIRDTVQEPIFMIEHKEENETTFILPTKNKLACIFKLSAN